MTLAYILVFVIIAAILGVARANVDACLCCW